VPSGSRLKFSNVSREIAKNLSWWFNHPMKRTVLRTVLIVAILGLACMGVSAPGKADEFKHPIELGAKCKAKFEYSLNHIYWHNQYYKAFAYAYDAKGRYTCALSTGEGRAIEKCNERRSSLASPPSINGNDLGGCKTYAKSPVNGKYAIVWKAKPKQVDSKNQVIYGKNTKHKPWAGYKTSLADQNYEMTIRYSDSGERYFARVSYIGGGGNEAMCNGSVDERGNLSKVDCTPGRGGSRELFGHVSRIELTSGGTSGGAIFVDKKLIQRIAAEKPRKLAEAKAEAEKQRPADPALKKVEAEQSADGPKDGRYFASHTNGGGITWTLELILKNQKIIKTKIVYDPKSENYIGQIITLDFNPNSGKLSGWLLMDDTTLNQRHPLSQERKITGKFPKLSMWNTGSSGDVKWNLVRQFSEEERLAKKKAGAEKQRLAELARKKADVNIKELQEGLSILGFYGGILTGDNNLETISSIQNWQAKEGLPITDAISSDQAIKIKKQAIVLINQRKKLKLIAEESARKLTEAKAATDKKRLVELTSKKTQEEKKRLAEEARLAAVAEKKRLARLKVAAEKKRMAELAKKKEIVDKKRLAELAHKNAAAEKRLRDENQKLHASFKNEIGEYLSDVQTYIAQNQSIPNFLDLVTAAADVKKWLSTKNGKALQSSITKLKLPLSKDKSFTEFRSARMNTREKERQNKITKLHNELDVYLIYIEKTIASNLVSNTDLSLALVPLAKTLKKEKSSNKIIVLKGLKHDFYMTLKTQGLKIDLKKLAVSKLAKRPDGTKSDAAKYKINLQKKSTKKVQGTFGVSFVLDKLQFVLAAPRPWRKEMGDGFTSFEARQNESALPVILKIKNTHNKKIKLKGVLKIKVVNFQGKEIQSDEEASKAFAAEEDIIGEIGKTLSPKSQLVLGIAFVARDDEVGRKGWFIKVIYNKKSIDFPF
jgi:hypothetical protein